MRVGCIIQARLGSTRLPGKVLMDIGGWPMLKHIKERLRKLDIPIIVASPPQDEIPGAEFTECANENVLQRYLLVAQRHGFDGVMRVTGDCPLIDPFACEEVLRRFQIGCWEYVANDLIKSFPDGIGVEMFTTRFLRWCHENVDPDHPDREHVSPFMVRYIKRYPHVANNVFCPVIGADHYKFSVDTQEDLDRVRAIDAAKPADFSTAATIEAYRRAQDQTGIS